MQHWSCKLLWWSDKLVAMKLEATYHRRFFFYFLLLVLIGVWVRVIYAVYEHVEREDMLLSEHASLLNHRSHSDVPVTAGRPAYIADFPDPFEPAKSLFEKAKPADEKVSVSKKEVIVPEIPVLTLKGVTGITAMVNGADDVVHFVVPGDSIGEVKILEVAKDHVLAKFENTTFILNLKS